MLLLEALLWSGLERSDKNKDNLFREAASNVSSCSTWQLKNKRLTHRFDAQASWQGNRWVISLFLSLRSTSLEIIVCPQNSSALVAAGSVRGRPRPSSPLCSFVSFVVKGLFP